MLKKRMLVPLALALLAGLLPLLLDGKPAASAATVPDSFSNSTFVDGLSRPRGMGFASDGRLFVAEQGASCASSKTVSCCPSRLST